MAETLKQTVDRLADDIWETSYKTEAQAMPKIRDALREAVRAALAEPTTEMELMAIDAAFSGGDVVAVWNAMSETRLKELG